MTTVSFLLVHALDGTSFDRDVLAQAEFTRRFLAQCTPTISVTRPEAGAAPVFSICRTDVRCSRARRRMCGASMYSVARKLQLIAQLLGGTQAEDLLSIDRARRAAGLGLTQALRGTCVADATSNIVCPTLLRSAN